MAELDPVKLNKFRNAMVAKGYPLNKIDQYLTTKTKQYGKTESVETEDEREKNRARIALRKDAMEGVPYYELGPKYGQIIEPYEIEEEYMKGPTAGQYGKPKEPQSVQQRWKEPPIAPKAPTEAAERKRRVVEENIIRAIKANKTREDIEAYILSEGFVPEDFPVLSEYTPKKQGDWWNPFD